MRIADVVLAVLGLGLGTMVFRLLFAELRQWCSLPPLIEATLEWVPVAVLAALVAPALLPVGAPSAVVPSLGAGLVAGIATYRTRNLLLSVSLGMGVFWTLGAVF